MAVCITAKGETSEEARNNVYKATQWITFPNKDMSINIGKAIDAL